MEKIPVREAALAKSPTGAEVIRINFSFNIFDLERVKTLPGRVYHKEQKCWSAPLNPFNARKLQEWGYFLHPTLVAKFKPEKEQAETPKEYTLIDIPGLQGTLRPFQNIGVQMINNLGGRALLADDMGLGKTIQAIAYMQMHRGQTPVVVVCPASVKRQWANECVKWMPDVSICLLEGTKGYCPQKADIYIVNYNILPNDVETIPNKKGKELLHTGWVDYLLDLNPQLLITDECHYFKSNDAQRTHAVMKFKNVPHCICISGTPIENRPAEIYNAWKLLSPTDCPSLFHFRLRYCDAKLTKWGWEYKGASNMKELHEILTSTIMIRRKKREVLNDLPEVTNVYLPVEIDNQEDYDMVEDDLIQFVRNYAANKFDQQMKPLKRQLKKMNIDIDEMRENFVEEKAMRVGNAAILAQVEYLKQVTAQGKLKQTIEWIADFLESGQKLVVFARHKEIVDAFMSKFKKCALKIDGSAPPKDRQTAIDNFTNNDNIQLFIISEAAAEGVNLQIASYMLVYEYPWTPGKLDQIKARVDRMGAKHPITIYFSVGVNTVDEKIVKLLDGKRKVIDAVIDGKDTEVGSLLTELIKQYS